VARERSRSLRGIGGRRVRGFFFGACTLVPNVGVLTENKTYQGFFERPELEAVVAALPDYLRDFTRFVYLTGWRKGEIISLKWTTTESRSRGTACAHVFHR
jgi:integrase